MPQEDRFPVTFTQLGAGTFLLLLAAALLGLRSGSSDSSKSSPAPAPGQSRLHGSAVSSDTSAPHRAFILNYLRRTLPLPADPQASKDCGSPGLIFTRAEARRLQVLIATVPDPVDTAFGFSYDQIVEALTRAVCDTGDYAPAGFWSPWEEYRLQVNSKEDRPSGSVLEQTVFTRFPGVLLFRGTDATDQAFAVLLVSETVNSVREQALREALNVAWEIQTLQALDGLTALASPSSWVSLPHALASACKILWTAGTIRLISPAFSGSQPSLLHVLEQWSEKRWVRFEIISGAANALNPLEQGSWAQKRITLQATVLPLEVLSDDAVRFLQRQRSALAAKVNYEGVALLAESNTGFGRAALERVARKESSLDPTDEEGRSWRWPLFFPYPLHISRLQAAYAQRRQDIEKRIGLNPSLLDPRHEDRRIRPNPDAFRSLDEETTAAINDRSVDDITAAISRNSVRMVGILATDPQDKIFLVERIKRDCPNVDIFITGLDLLYALPENRQIMRGVVVSTTYPLYPPNQGWAEPDEPRRQAFRSQFGQGYYNAAGFHFAGLFPYLALSDRVQEYTAPSFAVTAEENERRPPTWIVTIGENGHVVPLTFFKPDLDRTPLLAGALPPSRETHLTLPALGPLRMAALLVLISASITLWLFLQRRSLWVLFGASLSGRQRYDWLRPPMLEPKRRVSVYRNLILSALMISLFSLARLTWLLLTPPFLPPWPQRLCLVTILVALLAATGISLALQLSSVFRYARSYGGRRRLRWGWWLRLATHLLLAGGTLAFGLTLFFWSAPDPAARVLFVDRATEMSNGYSVLPPVLLMCAAFLVHGYFALKRDYLGKAFHLKCPYPEIRDGQVASPVARVCLTIRELSQALQRDLTDFAVYRWRHRKVFLTGTLVFVSAVLMVGMRAHHTIEGRPWNGLFLTGFILLASLVLLHLMRFLEGWKGLEKVLKMMALVPMVRAFDRLPRKTAALFGGYLFARRPRLAHLAIPKHLLRQLQHEAAEATKPAPSPVVGAPVAAVASQMPHYGKIPHEIALRLGEESFTFPEEADGLATERNGHAAAARPAADPSGIDAEYPSHEINRLSGEAQRLIKDLQSCWPWHTVTDAFGKQVPGDAAGKTKGQEEPAAGMPAWVEKAEDFVAVQAIIFLSQFFILLRALALAMVWVALLLLLAATIYPFQPEKLILYLLLGLLGVVVCSVLWVLVQINRNEIIGRITQSTPNRFELNWTFLWTVLHLVGPVALIVAVQLSGRLRAILDPLLNLIR